MSDDEAILEFKIGETAPNPWDDSSFITNEETRISVPTTPVRPAHSKSRISRSDSDSQIGLPGDLNKLKIEFEDELVNGNEPRHDDPHILVGKNAVNEPRDYEVKLRNPNESHEASIDTELDTLRETSMEKSIEKPIEKPNEKHSEKPIGNLTGTDTPIFNGIVHSETHGDSINRTDEGHSENHTENQPSFETNTSDQPTETDVKNSNHKRGQSSHLEYYQDPFGKVEARKVDDESGLTINTEEQDDDCWEQMATVGSHEVYDDKNNLIVKQETEDADIAVNAAAAGYSRVANNDDAASINSLDEKTDFLFDAHKPTDDVDAGFQMAATKSMLTEQQKIAYAGLCRLILAEIANKTRKFGSKSAVAVESLQIWGTSFMRRLYNHLSLNNEEQLMIESLAAHNLLAEDLTPCLKQVQKVNENGMTTEINNKNPDIDVNDLHEDLPSMKEINQSLEVDVKWTVMCDLFLVLLADAEYDARARTLLILAAGKLGVTTNEVAQFERKVTDVLQIEDNADQDWTEEDIIEARRRKTLRKKYAYVGLATVGGGLVIGLSGGLLAPVVGAGLAGALGTIGIAGTGGFLAGAGGTAMIATASTAIGARVGSKSMSRRVGHVKTFEMRPIFNNNRVNLVITVSGWMTGKEDDVRLPFSTIDPLVGDIMSVLWEPEMMRSLGQTVSIFATEALAFGVQQILAATVFQLLMTSLTAPMWLAKLSYLVDNPWSVSLDRAWAAGLILADTLMQRKLGKRPAILVGYSLGARVIYSCITELARRNAFGLVQDVFLFGTPVFYNKKQFSQARAVVSGRFVNGYSRKDWILAFLFPTMKKYGSVLGLEAVPEDVSEVLDIENIDVSEYVDGHMNYRAKMPVILKMCGWPVLSEEFDEIEDPDPEHTREKQLRLLNELEAAEEKPKKTGIFSSWGLDWIQRAKPKTSSNKTDTLKSDGSSGVEGTTPGQTLFDVDSIRNELESLKPRMVFEQEQMPLPEQNAENLPLELLEVEMEPAAPLSAMDYDAAALPKPKVVAKHHSSSPKAEDLPKLQFDDLE